MNNPESERMPDAFQYGMRDPDIPPPVKGIRGELKSAFSLSKDELRTPPQKVTASNERQITPEEKEEICKKLKDRFEAEENQALYADTGITWERVENSMEDEDWWSAFESEKGGHNVTIFMADDQGFWFGTRTDEAPDSTRNMVYDEKAAQLVEEIPCTRPKSAVKSAKDIGLTVMTREQGYHIVRKTQLVRKTQYTKKIEDGWRWYFTDPDSRLRIAGRAFDGCRYGNNLRVFHCDAAESYSDCGWGGARRVLYKN